MKTYSAASVVVASVTMLLCGILNAALNILQRFSHFMDTVRTAAEFNTDLTSVSDWADIAVSVYDVYAVFNLSSGILAAVQIAAGAAGIISAVIHTYGKNKDKPPVMPLVFGVLCTVSGAVGTASLIASRGAGAFLAFTLVLTQLVVPIIFLRTSIKYRCAFGTKGTINRGDVQ